MKDRLLKRRMIFSLVFLTLLILSFDTTTAGSGAEETDANKDVEGVLERKTLSRFYDPVEFRSEILEGLLGKKLSHLRLYSYVEGSFRQVPFQIDEWTEDGFLVLDQGPDQNGERSNGILDKQDMLVFMARDAGDRASRDLWPEAAGQGTEIEVLDPSTGEKGWCYLFHFSESAPETDFPIRTTIEETKEVVMKGTTWTMVGTNITSGGRVYKTISNSHVWTTPEGGGDGRDFIDRNKIRIEARFLFGLLKIRLDEGNFVGEASKYKKGPVRSIVRQWIGFKLPLSLHHLKTPKFFLDCYFYDAIIFIGAETNMPFNPGYVLTDLKIQYGYDLHDPGGYGMRWYNSNNMEGFLADGVTSPMEAEYDDRFDKWRCTVGPNGWMVNSGTWDKGYFEQADIRIHYRDDIEHHNPPDYYPGDLGYFFNTSTIKSLKPRKYKFQVEWYFPYDFYDSDGLRLDIIDQIVSIKDKPLEIRVDSRQVTSNGNSVSVVEP